MVKVKTTITVTYENFPDEANEIVIETSIPKKFDYNVTVDTYKDAINFCMEELIIDFSDAINRIMMEENKNAGTFIIKDIHPNCN